MIHDTCPPRSRLVFGGGENSDIVRIANVVTMSSCDYERTIGYDHPGETFVSILSLLLCLSEILLLRKMTLSLNPLINTQSRKTKIHNWQWHLVLPRRGSRKTSVEINLPDTKSTSSSTHNHHILPRH